MAKRTCRLENKYIPIIVEDDRRRQNSSNRIYERFFSTKLGGSGVGLAICQTIIKAHGGKLEARAIEFYVTIFRVILPLGGEE